MFEVSFKFKKLTDIPKETLEEAYNCYKDKLGKQRIVLFFNEEQQETTVEIRNKSDTCFLAFAEFFYEDIDLTYEEFIELISDVKPLQSTYQQT